MARKHINTPTLNHEQLREEITRWADSEETRNLAFLKVICQSFYNKAEAYYKAGDTPDIKLQRLEEIRQALAEIGFVHGERTFTISARHIHPATSAADLLDVRAPKDCGRGQTCTAGVCG